MQAYTPHSDISQRRTMTVLSN